MDVRLARGSLEDVWVMRVPPGADLYRSIQDVAREHGIQSGLILGGAASLRTAVLRNLRRFPDFPVTDDDRRFFKLEAPLEMLSISGNISTLNGQVWIHAHVVVSSGTEEGRCYGGHLVAGSEVLTTAEIAIAKLGGLEMLRLKDPETVGAELFFKTS